MPFKPKTICMVLTVAVLASPAIAQNVATDAHHEFLLAKLAAAEGRFDEALSRVDKVLRNSPNDPVLMLEKGVILIESGKIDRAEAELRKVVTAHPDFYDAQRLFGRLLLDRSSGERSKMDEALQHLRQAFKLNPDDFQTGTAISQLLVATGQVAEAEKVVAQLLERAPDQRALNYNYAHILTKLGRGDESKRYLERAVLLDPTFGPAILQLVDIYQKENEWEKAAAVLQPLIDQDPVNIDIQRQQAYLWLRSGNSEKARDRLKNLVAADPKDLRSSYFLAEALSDLNEHAEAEKIYRSLLEKTPAGVELLLSFGIAQAAQRKFDEAARTFNTLLAQKDLPDNVKSVATTQLAAIEVQKGNHAGALEIVKDLLVIGDKPNQQAINIAMNSFRKQKQYREAMVLLEPLVARFGSDPVVNARYVEMLVRAGETAKAQHIAAAQAKLGTRNALAVAEAYVQSGQHASALALLQEALKALPDDLDLNFSLGSAFERSGDRSSAEKAFLRILEKHPDHAPTLNYLGYMWADGNVHLERAAEMLQKAVSKEPRNGAFVDSLGWVYFRQGKLDLAEKYLTDAKDLLPRDATVHEHLGDVFARRGDYVRALVLYRTALNLQPEPKEEQKIRSKIADIEKQTVSSQR